MLQWKTFTLDWSECGGEVILSFSGIGCSPFASSRSVSICLTASGQGLKREKNDKGVCGQPPSTLGCCVTTHLSLWILFISVRLLENNSVFVNALHQLQAVAQLLTCVCEHPSTATDCCVTHHLCVCEHPSPVPDCCVTLHLCVWTPFMGIRPLCNNLCVCVNTLHQLQTVV